MPASMTFRSPTSSDAEILFAFESIATELGQDPDQCRVNVVVVEGYARNPGEATLSKFRDLPFVQLGQEKGGAIWATASIQFDPLRLRVSLKRDRERGDDEIHVYYREDPPDPAEVVRSLAAVQRHFVPQNRSEAIEHALGPELAEFYRRREEGLSRLEALTARLVKETHDYRMRLDFEAEEHKRALAASHGKNKEELEARYQKQGAELETRERDLDQRRRELDDRSARHARREQSRALQEKISDRSQRFSLTADTQRKRWPVHGIFVLLLLVTGGLIARSLFFPVTATSGVVLWLELARLPLGALGFALTSVFYIRWNDRWFRQHADQEFRLQQLALDVDRAGYATEMLLEWQEEKSGDMPAVLVERLTTGLFTDQTTVARTRHPVEDVTGALLKASSGVRLDVPGIGEVTLTGRGIRKMDKQLAKERGE